MQHIYPGLATRTSVDQVSAKRIQFSSRNPTDSSIAPFVARSRIRLLFANGVLYPQKMLWRRAGPHAEIARRAEIVMPRTLHEPVRSHPTEVISWPGGHNSVIPSGLADTHCAPGLADTAVGPPRLAGPAWRARRCRASQLGGHTATGPPPGLAGTLPHTQPPYETPRPHIALYPLPRHGMISPVPIRRRSQYGTAPG